VFILPRIYYESVSSASPFVFSYLVSDLSNSCKKNSNIKFIKHELSTVNNALQFSNLTADTKYCKIEVVRNNI